MRQRRLPITIAKFREIIRVISASHLCVCQINFIETTFSQATFIFNGQETEYWWFPDDLPIERADLRRAIAFRSRENTCEAINTHAILLFFFSFYTCQQAWARKYRGILFEVCDCVLSAFSEFDRDNSRASRNRNRMRHSSGIFIVARIVLPNVLENVSGGILKIITCRSAGGGENSYIMKHENYSVIHALERTRVTWNSEKSVMIIDLMRRQLTTFDGRLSSHLIRIARTFPSRGISIIEVNRENKCSKLRTKRNNYGAISNSLSRQVK